MSHQTQLLLYVIAGACVAGVIVALLMRRPAAKKTSAKKRPKRKAKRTGKPGRRTAAAVARRSMIETGSMTTNYPVRDRTANARDVAAYIVQKIGPVTPMKLNRLIAIVQGAAIAEDGRPLFQDTITASATGPIPTALFKELAGKATVEDVPDGESEMLVPKAQERIDEVLARCAALDEHNLNRLTCTSPWRDARARGASGGGDPVIENGELSDIWKMIADRLAPAVAAS